MPMIPKLPGSRMRRNPILQLHITSEEDLYKSFLPFLKYGGLFIPTNSTYKLGEEVFLRLTLLKESDGTSVVGKVVWINPKGAQGGRPSGIGVHFNEMDKGVTRDKIEKALVNLLKSERPTHTM